MGDRSSDLGSLEALVEREPLMPNSPREVRLFRDIRNVLARYVVKGVAKDIDVAALRIWRVTRRHNGRT